ncbi:unnamed protein product, partial [Chrysoparadoxa australica]
MKKGLDRRWSNSSITSTRSAPGIVPSAAAATLEPVVSKLERFVLYESQPLLYLVGCDKLQTQYRVLKI